MSVTVIFVFGIIVTVIGLGATLLFVLTEAADPGATSENTLTAFERFFIGKKRKKMRESMEAHDKRVNK